MPERLWLDRYWSAVLVEGLLAAAPEEGCALLLGRSHGSLLTLEVVWPCLNVWGAGWPETFGFDLAAMPGPRLERDQGMAPSASRRNRFAIDPREQLLAEKWARRQGLQVLGSAHSHPEGEAVPSAIDRAWVLAPTLMLICTPGPDNGGLGAWWFPSSPGDPHRLALIGNGEGGPAAGRGASGGDGDL
ncbi:M67 family metallopeptidase [Cyanobium sp. Morenito 9A2]|uniref:M67 family metallopeptidase n=1 Tax=Cyanobium sp. Morenito 9A2 TaxID=2823718 RepID=UPI0020CCC728|nr:M67 family metallopeptidase [Cyanobium sp. Morenito 9A2]MCP9850608.1 M67 family metallopeptidase [Cyanobium sp. Morenito 9A2]